MWAVSQPLSALETHLHTHRTSRILTVSESKLRFVNLLPDRDV